MNRWRDSHSAAARRLVVTLALGSLIGCGASGSPDPSSQIPGDRLSVSPPVETSLAEPYPIEITGHEYQWHIRYPGADGTLGTSDDLAAIRHLHVPQGTDVVLMLNSADYLYTFALPDLGVKEIAVPDLEFQVTLCAERPGRYELRGDQLCGFSHPQLLGNFIVEPREKFLTWVNSQPAVAGKRSPTTSDERNR